MTVNPSENILENSLVQQQDPSISEEKVALNPSETEAQTSEDPNWKAFREARKKDRKEKEDAIKRASEKEAEVIALKEAMEAAFNKNNSALYQGQSNQNHYMDEETEDQRIEKKVQAALYAREKQAEEARFAREREEYPQRLIQNYSDFNQVISDQNLDYLDFHFPEVSRPLKRLSDDYAKWEDIYKAVKKFVPNSVSHKQEAAKAEANFNKPKSMSSANITPTGQAISSSRLTEERRAENYARMQKVLKSVG